MLDAHHHQIWKLYEAGCLPNQEIQGNQGIVFWLKYIREKSGILTKSRDNQGNIRETVSYFLQ